MATSLNYNFRISLIIFKKVSMILKVFEKWTFFWFLINVLGVSIGLQLVSKIL